MGWRILNDGLCAMVSAERHGKATELLWPITGVMVSFLNIMKHRGGMGRVGWHLTAASLNAGHPTVVLVRSATAGARADNPAKAKLIEELCNNGARLVYGDVNDHEILVAAIKNADVVICAIGHTTPDELVVNQLKIMEAIQDAGSVKRFVPSEYGCNVELAEQMLEPARSIVGAKLRVREAVTASRIPHTIVCGYWIHSFLLPKAGNPEADAPPAMFVDEKDISTVTIKAVEDPRTLNKILYVRPPANLCSLNQLVSVWEKKIGRDLEKCYVPEEELARKIEELNDIPVPAQPQLAMVHSTLLPGVASCGQIAIGFVGVEATELYPDMEYVTVEDCSGLTKASPQEDMTSRVSLRQLPKRSFGKRASWKTSLGRRAMISTAAAPRPREGKARQRPQEGRRRSKPRRCQPGLAVLMGYVVITTPNGVLDHEEAIRQNVGGQVLGYF
uniref:Small ribosomal subunit protein uS8c n=1 Tax=Oryza punctata TaxID=4537 RepID=A0A0E0JG50_ORYPU